MRLFVAVEVPKNIEDKLKSMQSGFRGLAKIKFVNTFHCTLKFLGEVNENSLEKIKNRLKTIKFNSFDCKIKDIGVFPNEKRINVIWVGANSNIIELQKKIDMALLDLFPKDERFHGHITFGRVKFIKNREELLKKIKIKFEDNFLVNNFKLIKSDLTKEGPRYTILEEYKLS